MNYKLIWKTASLIVIVISAVMLAPAFLKIYELSDNMIRILGVADLVGLFVLGFSFVKSVRKH